MIAKVLPDTSEPPRKRARNDLQAPRSGLLDKLEEPLLRYDVIARIKVHIAKPELAKYKDDDNTARELQQLLSRALGDRVKLMHITKGSANSNAATSHATTTTEYVCAFVLDPTKASRMIDRGPPVEDPTGVAEFRQFWGNKAELRRFADGSMLECVLWNAEDDVPKIEQIISHVLLQHFDSLTAKTCTFEGLDFSGLNVQSTTAISASFDEVLSTYKTLADQIRKLDGLPLQVRDVHLAESGLRNAMLPRLATRARQWQQPLDIVLQFEGSGQWPDDLEAIQMTKGAFLLKLSELLSNASSSTTMRIGLENEERDIQNRMFLDIIYKSGLAFRLRIFHNREMTLINQQLGSKVLGGIDRDAAAIALAEYKRSYVVGPLHAQSMQRLATKHRAFPSTVVAVQTWFSSHLLSSHFAPQIVELLVARVFLQPGPRQAAPATSRSGLSRTLSFLSGWDWEHEPLVLEFSEPSSEITPIAGMESGPVDHKAAQLRFEAWRKLDPSMNRLTLFIATNYDTDGGTWTTRQPARLIATRMSRLAQAATKVIKDAAVSLEAATLYKSPLKDYDFVLHLSERFANPDRWALKRTGANEEHSKFKNLQKQQAPLDQTLIGYSPVVSFLHELQHTFADAAIFFHNLDSCTSGDTVIAGLWNRQTEQRRWKVNLPYSSALVSTTPHGTQFLDDMEKESESADAVLNKSAILAEMARLGDDLITRVEER